MDIKSYEILEASTCEDLRLLVMRWVAQGFEPLGGVTKGKLEGHKYKVTYAQAMVKHK